MVKYICILLVIVSFSCTLPQDEIPEYPATVAEAAAWVHDNITWTDTDFFQTPEEIYLTRIADCDGMSYLFMTMLRQNLYIDSTMLTYYVRSAGQGHAVVLVDGEVWDLTKGEIITVPTDWQLIMSWSWEQYTVIGIY